MHRKGRYEGKDRYAGKYLFGGKERVGHDTVYRRVPKHAPSGSSVFSGNPFAPAPDQFETQGIEVDESLCIAVIVGNRPFLERDEVFVVQ